MDETHNDETETGVRTLISKYAEMARNLAIIAGCVYGCISFFVTQIDFNAYAMEQRSTNAELFKFKESTSEIIKKLFTLQCKIARVNKELPEKVVDETCKQL